MPEVKHKVNPGATLERAQAGMQSEPQPEAPVAQAPTLAVGGELTRIMALKEPQRTDAIEVFLNSARGVRLRSKTGEVVKVKHGEVIYTVPPEPREFAGYQGVHMLDKRPDLVEEVEE